MAGGAFPPADFVSGSRQPGQPFGWLIRIRFPAGSRKAQSPMLAALVLIVLGPFPDQEPTLYLTAVGLILLLLVFSKRRPRTASDGAAMRTIGGSNARRGTSGP